MYSTFNLRHCHGYKPQGMFGQISVPGCMELKMQKGILYFFFRNVVFLIMYPSLFHEITLDMGAQIYRIIPPETDS